MTERERAELIEAASTAYRRRDPHGQILAEPAWHDLDDEGRRELFEVARRQRALEAALDPDGLSGTARAVLARIQLRRL
jgi:hypothetical protein